MKRFDEVKIFDLKLGDRFYFRSDKRKIKWQIETVGKNQFNNVLSVGIECGIKKRLIKQNKTVVFLRNQYDIS